MNLFSQRRGIKPVKVIIQVDNIDEELRNRLWNLLDVFYWENAEPRETTGSISNRPYRMLANLLWHNLFKKPIDTIPGMWHAVLEALRKHFFSCDWNEVYDFIEFVSLNFGKEETNNAFVTACNSVLERELSGYRFVDGIISPITSEEEILEIEEAMKVSQPSGLLVHLKTALEKLSDRKSPDYRNSIKESISAVESLCALIVGNPKATLGDALGKIRREGKVILHPALNEAFDKLYGYTSDADGIRHRLMESPDLGFEDAKFMLVSCSAFINYLKVKAAKTGIKLEKK